MKNKIFNKSRILYFFKKSYIKNGIWMYLLQFFNAIVPLLTLPYITRVLGAFQYGLYALAINFVGYLQVLVEYGFGMSATREIALSSEDDRKTNQIFSEVLFSRVILYFIALAITLVYIILFNSNKILINCILASFLCLAGNVIQQNWLFQGLQDMKYISIVNIVGRMISVAMIFILIKEANDIVLYCILYAVSPFISGLIGLIVAKRKYNIQIIKITLSQILEALKKGWFVFTTSLSSKVFGAIGITFLGLFSENAIVGTFSAIQKIPNMVMLAWVPIGQIIYPISSQHMNESFQNGIIFIKQTRRKILPLFAFASGLIIIFSKKIVLIAFGEDYAKNYYWLIPLIIWLLLGINNNFLGIQTLLASGHDKEYSKCFQISVVFTVVINLVFIYFGKGMGASLAPAISELFLGILLRHEVYKLS